MYKDGRMCHYRRQQVRSWSLPTQTTRITFLKFKLKIQEHNVSQVCVGIPPYPIGVVVID